MATIVKSPEDSVKLKKLTTAKRRKKPPVIDSLHKSALHNIPSKDVLDAPFSDSAQARVQELAEDMIEEQGTDGRTYGQNNKEYDEENIDGKLKKTRNVSDGDLERIAMGQDVQTQEEVDAEEALLVLVYRMHSRRVPPKEIQNHLNISPQKYQTIFQKMKRYIRNEFMNYDILYSVGDSLKMYEDLMAMALQITGQRDIGMKDKLAAMSLALRVATDSNIFKESVGLHSPEIITPIVARNISRQLDDLQMKEKDAGVTSALTDVVSELKRNYASAKEREARDREELSRRKFLEGKGGDI